MERQKIIEMLNNEKYEEAMVEIENDTTNDAFLEFCSGYIYEQKKYENYSPLKAKEIYEKGIMRNDSVPQSYLFLACHFLYRNTKQDNDYAIETLKKGIVIHQDNERLAVLLLTLVEPEQIENLLNDTIELDKLSSSDVIIPYLIYSGYKDGSYKVFRMLVEEKYIKKYSSNDDFEIALLVGYSFFEIGKYDESLKIFSHIYTYDVRGEAKKYASLGRVLASYNADSTDLERFIVELSATYTHKPFSIEIGREWYYVEFNSYIEMLIKIFINYALVVSKPKLLGKIRGIRGYLKNENEGKGGISDLKYAVKYVDDSKEYYYSLYWYYDNREDYAKSFFYGLEYFYRATDKERRRFSFTLEGGDEVLEEAIKCATRKEFLFRDDMGIFIEVVIRDVVKALFEQKRYQRICRLVKTYAFESIANFFGFEVAYSLKYNGDTIEAQKYYEYITNHDELVSKEALNNLAVIYIENLRNEDGIALLEKAVIMSNNDKWYCDRLEDQKEKYKKLQNVLQEELNAVDRLKEENAWLLSILKNLYEHSDDNGYIECPHRLLPQYMRLKKFKAEEIISSFLEKRYVKKIPNHEHNIETQSTVYQINRYVDKELKKILLEESRFSEMAELLNGFSYNSFEEYGYDENLQNNLISIQDVVLRDMVLRDVKENFLSLITHSYKSSLVLSGSIIETLLLYKIKSSGINEYPIENRGKSKNIKVKEMSLYQLIEVSEKERIFTFESLKHSDAVRGYRNLIHPGVEVRKSANTPMVTKENANLAWLVVKKVIMELFTKRYLNL